MGRPDPATDPVAVQMRAEAPHVLGVFSEEYPDALALLARALGGREAAGSARLVGLDSAGLDIVVEGDAATDGAVAPVRVAFVEPIGSVWDSYDALVALVDVARRQVGGEAATTVERARAEARAIRTFLTEVVRARHVHPRLREVTVGGGDLVDLPAPGPDTFFHLLLPPPGRTELTVDRDFSWEWARGLPEADRPAGGYYTVRRWRPEVAELDLLMVLHGDEGGASRWAATAGPGDPVALWGPRRAFAPPETTDRYLLVADETGLPAVAAIVESLPSGTPVHVVAEVADAGSRQDVPEGDGVTIDWLHRDGAPPGTTSLLLDAVRALPELAPTTYAWGGAESRAMTAVRRHLRDERGLSRETVSMSGYWRRTTDPTA